jgi:o-succinylbenzoate synthase
VSVPVFCVPLRRRFRGIDVREGMLIRGDAGWAEFSPFLDYDDIASAPWLAAAREAADEEFPAPVRDTVPVNATVPAVPAGEVGAVLAAFPGCTTAKVKVAPAGIRHGVGAEDSGPAGDADVDRLAAVRACLGQAGRIRIDANGAWDVETAVAMIRRLDAAAGGLEYVEQPCATVEELAAVRRRVDVPIAADESIRHAEDPGRVVRLEAADIAVLKVQPLGGVRACLQIAEEIGIPVVVSSALETSIGIAAGVALAAALPELPHACGLATVGLLGGDVVADPLVAVDGAIPVRRPEPDPGLLRRWSSDASVEAGWAARLRRVDSVRRNRDDRG